MTLTNINSQLYYETALKNGFKVTCLNHKKALEIAKNEKKFRLYATLLPVNDAVAARISQDKVLSAKLLGKEGLPILKQTVVAQSRQPKLIRFFPVVVKPNFCMSGRGVTVGVKTQAELEKALETAYFWHPEAIIEKYQAGENYRILVAGNRVIACCRRFPPTIEGDGISTVIQLINKENQWRWNLNKKKNKKIFEKIEIDGEVKRLLKQNGLSLKSVLSDHHIFWLRRNANLSTGGTVETVFPNQFHPSFLTVSIKAAQIIGLKIAALDIIAKDIKKPCQRPNAAINEINHQPDLRLHYFPAKGKVVDAAVEILNFLYENL